MPLYMFQFAYTPEAWASLVEHPEDRSAPVKQLIESLGGQLLSFHYCRGEYDGIVIAEAPDESTINATAFTAISAGHLKSAKTTELFELEDVMESLRKAATLVFQGATH